MKTDRDLLELAAKAAGIVGLWHERGQCIHVTDCAGMSDIWWRPLQDDGDALRLAVKLQLELTVFRDHVTAYNANGWYDELNAGDPESATRRAIVRAAAAIGEQMQ